MSGDTKAAEDLFGPVKALGILPAVPPSYEELANRCAALEIEALGDNAQIERLLTENEQLSDNLQRLSAPVALVLWCPHCGSRHVDEGEFAKKPHHTHACQKCGLAWRPALVATVGVQFLPGFKDRSTK